MLTFSSRGIHFMARYRRVLLSSCVLVLACASAELRAGTVQQFDASVATSARAGTGLVVTSTLQPEENGAGTYVENHTAAAGQSASATQYTFVNNGSEASFRINLNHTSALSDQSLAKSDGQIEFVVSSPAKFS